MLLSTTVTTCCRLVGRWGFRFILAPATARDQGEKHEEGKECFHLKRSMGSVAGA